MAGFWIYKKGRNTAQAIREISGRKYWNNNRAYSNRPDNNRRTRILLTPIEHTLSALFRALSALKTLAVAHPLQLRAFAYTENGAFRARGVFTEQLALIDVRNGAKLRLVTL